MSTKQKRAQAKIIWEHYTTISPEKHDSSRGEGLSSLPEGKWAVASSKDGWRRECEEWIQDRRRK